MEGLTRFVKIDMDLLARRIVWARIYWMDGLGGLAEIDMDLLARDDEMF